MSIVSENYEPAADAFRDRVILVTGAGSGIGRAVSEKLAGYGATVVLLGSRPGPLEKTFDTIQAAGGPEPAIVVLDLAAASPQNYQELAKKIEEDLGRLDGVVHNAARFENLKPLDDVSAKEWYTTLQVNLSGPYLMTQCLLPLLRESDAGRMIFTLDDAERTACAYWGAYGVSKIAAEGLMRILADELESTTVRVCGVRPGPTRTTFRARAWAAEDPSRLAEPSARVRAFLYLLEPGNEPKPGVIIEA
jgi:NAD(P)-dependent dehydrogenase (short-subunit alcohol dehydrogenase family)